VPVVAALTAEVVIPATADHGAAIVFDSSASTGANLTRTWKSYPKVGVFLDGTGMSGMVLTAGSTGFQTVVVEIKDASGAEDFAVCTVMLGAPPVPPAKVARAIVNPVSLPSDAVMSVIPHPYRWPADQQPLVEPVNQSRPTLRMVPSDYQRERWFDAMEWSPTRQVAKR
jgi:hypothetical protein